ncbi:hypothetical protein [Parachlamydia sp. AcF125]|uniref:hypothetical protein n=1 Tax=Parachlamydia sp. AcF125 TaxID=2795736 RepID=UPI001BCA14DE|nr:hypothetical protein [Parachlamydia sp. AcF125]
MRLEVNFYPHADGYGRLYQRGANLKSHLLIGSDIDEKLTVVDKLTREVLIGQKQKLLAWKDKALAHLGILPR